jgi:hypothetical protein
MVGRMGDVVPRLSNEARPATFAQGQGSKSQRMERDQHRETAVNVEDKANAMPLRESYTVFLNYPIPPS